MSRNYSAADMNKQKQGLIIKMIQRKFENSLYDYLNNADFADMDSLDKWLDKEIAIYFDECDAVEEYYDKKTAELE